MTAAEQTRALATQSERVAFLTARGWQHADTHGVAKTWSPPDEPWRSFTDRGAVRYVYDHDAATQ